MSTFNEPKRDSYLGQDTPALFDRVSEQIQAGERRFGPVDARDHEKRVEQRSENLLENQASAHPKFNNQRWDGDDPNITPNPVDNPEAYEELKKELEEKQYKLQEQLQNRNELQNRNTFNPKPGMG